MATTIPVPIEFSLPDGWQAAPPDEVGAPEAGFVALRPPGSNGFTPNITISGDIRPTTTPLTTVADEAVAQIRETAGEVELRRRNEVGDPDSPGLTQTLRLRIELNGEARAVLQLQTFVAMRDTADPQRRAVLQVALTVAEEQLDDVVDDFQEFLRTLQPDTGQGGGQS